VTIDESVQLADRRTIYTVRPGAMFSRLSAGIHA